MNFTREKSPVPELLIPFPIIRLLAELGRARVPVALEEVVETLVPFLKNSPLL